MRCGRLGLRNDFGHSRAHGHGTQPPKGAGSCSGALFFLYDSEGDGFFFGFGDGFGVPGFAEGFAAGGLGEEIGDGGGAEDLFDVGHGIVEALVDGAEAGPVALEAKRAIGDAWEGVDRLGDVVEGDLVSRSRQHRAAVQAALRGDEATATEALEYLGEVAFRDVGRDRDLAGGHGLAVSAGDEGDDAEGIFEGLGKHMGFPVVVRGTSDSRCPF
jgi:hypothetical protein